jgi:hypothetical protein
LQTLRVKQAVDSKLKRLCEADRGDMGRLKQQVDKRRAAEALVAQMTEEGCNSNPRMQQLKKQRKRAADADSKIDEIIEGAIAKRMSRWKKLLSC